MVKVLLVWIGSQFHIMLHILRNSWTINHMWWCYSKIYSTVRLYQSCRDLWVNQQVTWDIHAVSLFLSLLTHPSDFILAAWRVCSIKSRSNSDSRSHMRAYRYVLICTQHTHTRLSVWVPPSLPLKHTWSTVVSLTVPRLTWLAGWVHPRENLTKRNPQLREKSISVFSSFLKFLFTHHFSINQTNSWYGIICALWLHLLY